MKIWVTSFIILFGLAELYQWVSHFSVPLPVFILGGVALAIASNYDKRARLPFNFRSDQIDSDDADFYIDTPSQPVPPANRPVSFTIPKTPKPR